MFAETYATSEICLLSDEWQYLAETNDPAARWHSFIEKTEKMSGNKNIVVLDNLCGITCLLAPSPLIFGVHNAMAFASSLQAFVGVAFFVRIALGRGATAV